MSHRNYLIMDGRAPLAAILTVLSQPPTTQCPTTSQVPTVLHSTLILCQLGRLITRLHSSSRHMLHILRTGSIQRQDIIGVRCKAALTMEPRLPLVQPTLCGPCLRMSRGAEGCRDHRTTSLMFTRKYHLHQVTCAFRRINSLEAPPTQQGTIPLERLPLELQQPIQTINSLWQRVALL